MFGTLSGCLSYGHNVGMLRLVYSAGLNPLFCGEQAVEMEPAGIEDTSYPIWSDQIVMLWTVWSGYGCCQSQVLLKRDQITLLTECLELKIQNYCVSVFFAEFDLRVMCIKVSLHTQQQRDWAIGRDNSPLSDLNIFQNSEKSKRFRKFKCKENFLPLAFFSPDRVLASLLISCDQKTSSFESERMLRSDDEFRQ